MLSVDVKCRLRPGVERRGDGVCLMVGDGGARGDASEGRPGAQFRALWFAARI
jgi:hypothetical protein